MAEAAVVPVCVSTELKEISVKCCEILDDFHANGFEKMNSKMQVLDEYCNTLCRIVGERSLWKEWKALDERNLEGRSTADLKIHYELHKDIMDFHTNIEAANLKFASLFLEHSFRFKQFLHPKDISLILSFCSHANDTYEMLKNLESRLLNLKIIILL